MSELAVNMGGRIRALRKTHKMSTSELAEKSGIPSTSVESIEEGEQPPSLEQLIAISNALDISLDFLVFGYNERVQTDMSPVLFVEGTEEEAERNLDKLLDMIEDQSDYVDRVMDIFLNYGVNENMIKMIINTVEDLAKKAYWKMHGK